MYTWPPGEKKGQKKNKKLGRHSYAFEKKLEERGRRREEDGCVAEEGRWRGEKDAGIREHGSGMEVIGVRREVGSGDEWDGEVGGRREEGGVR